MASPPPPRLCVTGGGGYIASWLVKLLLSRGYAVHATVRDPSDPKNAHLRQLDGAPDRLFLFKADVLDRDALAAAATGCEGVFHVASPVPADKVVDHEAEVLGPAVKGTLNVLEACSANNIQKVVVVSSTAAVQLNPSWPQDRIKDESCWSDKDFCLKNGDWYAASKTIAEETALEYGDKNGVIVATVCPCVVLGPLLQPVVNTTSELLVYIIKGGPRVMKNVPWNVVDVRDVADALLLVYVKVESSGRYICAPNRICTKDIVNLLKKAYPNYNYVNCDDMDYESAITPVASEKLKNLGWKPRKIEETLLDSTEHYEKAGLLQDLEELADERPTSAELSSSSSSTFALDTMAEGAGSVPGSRHRQNVCVTGAGGYIASWLVKLLLSRGYAVHATVRDPSDPKNAHLGRLEGASENLRLFKADVLDQDSLAAAVAGCQGVFHAACPVPTDKVLDPEAEVLAPAVQGTLNILQACSANNVQKVVVVSSTAAVHFNPNWPRDRPKDENCWSDISFCEKNEDWYMVAKVIAEKTALEYADKTGLNIVTVCPTMALGPLLRPVVNVSHEFLIYITKGGPTVMKNIPWHIVDVRDVADALLLLYEKEGSIGRYICAPHHISAKDLVNLLKKARPNYNYVNCDNDLDPNSIVTPLMSEKLKNLGWKPKKKLEETFLDSVEYYEKARLLQDIEGRPCRLPHLFHMAIEK